MPFESNRILNFTTLSQSHARNHPSLRVAAVIRPSDIDDGHLKMFNMYIVYGG